MKDDLLYYVYIYLNEMMLPNVQHAPLCSYYDLVLIKHSFGYMISYTVVQIRKATIIIT